MLTTAGNAVATPSAAAEYLRKQIDALAGIKTQREIALEAGYEKPNVISMMKTGQVRIPLDKVPALAKAIHVDPAYLFRLVMMEYWPDRADAVAQIFGTVTTANEREIIVRIRELTNNTDPALTEKLDNKLKIAFG